MPSINKQPPHHYAKPRLPSHPTNNRVKTIQVSPTSNGGIIQLQTGYGIKTNHDTNEFGSGKKRETVPPVVPPPPPQSQNHVALATERPSFYYNPKLDEIFPPTPPTYTPPPTEPTIYNRPLHNGYTLETGKIKKGLVSCNTHWKFLYENVDFYLI